MQQPPPNNHQPEAEAEPEAVAMLCLQAQQVAGLPDAAEGRHIQLSTTTTCAPPPPAAAVSVCRAGVADFHRQVLLLHCAPVSSIDAVAVTVTMADTCRSDQQHPAAAAAARIVARVTIDLAEQLRRRPCPSPSVLSFVLGVSGSTTAAAAATAAAGAVLSLTLHHRLLVTTTRTRTGCSLLRSCLRVPLAAGCCPPVLRTTTKQNRIRQRHQGPMAASQAHDDDDGDRDRDSSSSGFITIEKGTVSRRRPPSDYLLTTDDDEVDGKRPPPHHESTTTCCWSSSSLDRWLDGDDTKVEDDFLAMLMLQDDDDLDLDALIKVKDAEADLHAASIWPSRG